MGPSWQTIVTGYLQLGLRARRIVNTTSESSPCHLLAYDVDCLIDWSHSTKNAHNGREDSKSRRQVHHNHAYWKPISRRSKAPANDDEKGVALQKEVGKAPRGVSFGRYATPSPSLLGPETKRE